MAKWIIKSQSKLFGGACALTGVTLAAAKAHSDNSSFPVIVPFILLTLLIVAVVLLIISDKLNYRAQNQKQVTKAK